MSISICMTLLEKRDPIRDEYVWSLEATLVGFCKRTRALAQLSYHGDLSHPADVQPTCEGRYLATGHGSS